MSYTKGPWEIRATLRGDFDIDTSSAEPRLGYIVWEGLATFYGSNDNRRVGREVARANATLAAAAPIMADYIRRRADAGDIEAAAIIEKATKL